MSSIYCTPIHDYDDQARYYVEAIKQGKRHAAKKIIQTMRSYDKGMSEAGEA